MPARRYYRRRRFLRRPKQRRGSYRRPRRVYRRSKLRSRHLGGRRRSTTHWQWVKYSGDTTNGPAPSTNQYWHGACNLRDCGNGTLYSSPQVVSLYTLYRWFRISKMVVQFRLVGPRSTGFTGIGPAPTTVDPTTGIVGYSAAPTQDKLKIIWGRSATGTELWNGYTNIRDIVEQPHVKVMEMTPGRVYTMSSNTTPVAPYYGTGALWAYVPQRSYWTSMLYWQQVFYGLDVVVVNDNTTTSYEPYTIERSCWLRVGCKGLKATRPHRRWLGNYTVRNEDASILVGDSAAAAAAAALPPVPSAPAPPPPLTPDLK